MKFLIAGLGNIGAEYADTRHNIGFLVADKVASDNTFTSERYAFRSEVRFKGKTLVLIKPTTFMNLSGNAVRYWLQQEKIPVENLLVVTDDLALPFGKLRIRPKGSAGGHNGLQHIIETLGTDAFPRLRFGISNDFSKGQQVDYVLGKWSPEEIRDLGAHVERAAKACQTFATIGLARTMNEFN